MTDDKGTKEVNETSVPTETESVEEVVTQTEVPEGIEGVSVNETELIKVHTVEETTEVVISEDSPEVEEIEGDAEEMSEEDELEEAADNKKNRKKMIALGAVVILILAGFAGLFYRFYPLPSKISGQWEASSSVNGNYLIKNDGKKSTFVMTNLNGVVGMDMIFESQLTAEAENEYFVTDTHAYLELYHEYITAEMIEGIIGDGTNFEEVSDNKKTKKLKYTKAGIEASFGNQNLNDMFKYVLRDFGSGLQGKTLKLRNASFATGGVTFTRSEGE